MRLQKLKLHPCEDRKDGAPKIHSYQTFSVWTFLGAAPFTVFVKVAVFGLSSCHAWNQTENLDTRERAAYGLRKAQTEIEINSAGRADGKMIRGKNVLGEKK